MGNSARLSSDALVRAVSARDEVARRKGFKDYNDQLRHDITLRRGDDVTARLDDAARAKIIGAFGRCFGD